ncbi:cytochrome P450 [Streptomyces sp. NBC_00076]|uniref:cytochrome P450 n=1 Tax=Streptomyces sp. NBC_00076 TaxID=2975642 RepID=UPI00324F0F58
MTTAATPVSDMDIFADDVLTDPYPAYAVLRETGAAVYLERYDCWALPRYEHVRAALRDHERFSSVDSVGYEPSLNEARRGGVLATDPPEHDMLRSVLSESLAPRALASLKDDIGRRATELVESVVARGSFDVVSDLARVFPLTVVADLIGMPLRARDEVLVFADAFFNTFGPLNERTTASVQVSERLLDELISMMNRDDLAPGGWGEALYQAADRGVIEEHQVGRLLRAYLVASMDTTINAISSALWLFAEHQTAWTTLRADRTLLRSAFDEVVRVESPVQTFFRRTTRAVEIDGVTIPPRAQVAMLFGSANRDPRKWPEPDTFDINRAPMDHVGFGSGVHACAGQGLARVEGGAILSALLDHVEVIQLDGPPRRHLNNVIRGLESLPVTVTSGALR